MNRGNSILPISDGVFSVLSVASIAPSRWTLRRSISSKSFNSVPSTNNRRLSLTAATKKNKRTSVISSNHKNSEFENDENNDNKFAVKSIDSRESWLGDMESLLKVCIYVYIQLVLFFS